MERKAFLDQEAPAGYVAGIGRGAAGFTTSADVGSASRIVPQDDVDSEDGGNEGDDKGLLASQNDEDDLEADRIYEQVEKRLTSKKTSGSSVEVSKDSESAVSNSFSDLKRALSSVTTTEWENLPEVGDLTKRNKRIRLLEKLQQRFYAVSDSILAGNVTGGLTLPTKTDFQSISQAKDKLLIQQLDGVLGDSGAVQDVQNVVLDDLIAAEEDVDSKIEDIKKGRLILASLRKTDPLNSYSWIASARLEEQAKKLAAAKSIIEQGCTKIPKNEAVWLERIRLNRTEGTLKCKLICSDGLKYNPKSEKLWLQAVELEHSADYINRRRTLMKALESIPASVTIWKALIEMEDTENLDTVKKLLSKAVELCPKEWEFWVSLINLSSYEDAKGLLNRARKSVSGNYMVWITALKLEERENSSISELKLIKVLTKGVQELAKSSSVVVTRNEWLKEATVAESEEFPMTCKAIVHVSLASEETELAVLLMEAESWKSFKQTSNNIFQYIIGKYPNSLEVWFSLFESLQGNHELLFQYYKQAIQLNPQQELFYLMFAKDLWRKANNSEEATKVLAKATTAFPNSELVWFARLKLSKFTATPWQRQTLKISTEIWENEKLRAVSPKVWYKHIHLLRCSNSTTKQELLDMSDRALETFPNNEKLYLQKSQIAGETEDSKVLAIAVRKCPNSTHLWISYAKSIVDNPVRSRAIFDSATTQNPNSAQLVVERIRFEKSLGNTDSARQLCTRALQKFPNDAMLWVEHLHLISKPSLRKNAFVDALKKTDNSPLILLHIGIFFWIDGKFQKVKTWFDRALSSGGRNNGDFWGWVYKYLTIYGDKKTTNQFLKEYEEHYYDINEGEVWNSLAKATTRDDFADYLGFLTMVSDKLMTGTPQLQAK